MGHINEWRTIEERDGKRFFVLVREYSSAGYTLSLIRASGQPEIGLRVNVHESSPGGHGAAAVISKEEASYLLCDDTIVDPDQVEVVEVKPERQF